MKKFFSRSLQLRLIFFLTIVLTITWIVTGIFAWKESQEYIDEFFDTQQLLLAKSIAISDFQFSGQLKKPHLTYPKQKNWGEVDDDVLAVAIFNPEGKLLLSDEKFGNQIPFSPNTFGFKEIFLKKSIWRIAWHPAPDKNFIVAVGQELDYRKEMALELLEEQIMPWLLMLPVLILGFIWILYQELKPLRTIKNELEKRQPGETRPLPTENMPSEIKPLLITLNNHFMQVASLLERERAFIANAAHELRTPLAGLRIQAEVALLPETHDDVRDHALKNLISGIDKSSRLADQLLVLAQIETLSSKNAVRETIFWPDVIQDVISEYRKQADKKNLSFTIQEKIALPAFSAPAVLPYILIRNLVDNAVRYASENSEICISFKKEGIVIQNNAPVLQESIFSRLGERFYRPSGQLSSGSGLGLSIAHQIASHLNLSLSLEKKPLDNPDQMQFIVFLGYH